MIKKKIRIEFTTEVLGTASNNKQIHKEYIASKAPDAKTREEEIEAIGAEEYEEKQMTVFPRAEDETPIIWDYQIKGFFKEACGALQRCKSKGSDGKLAPEPFAKASCGIRAYKKIIDSNIFIYPRAIPIHLSGEIKHKERPLRGQTAQGERIALANSEQVPAGSYIECEIECLSDSFWPAVAEWLDYGIRKGIGQWRNASHGRFVWEIIE